MERLTADSWGNSIFRIQLVKSLFLPWSITILLQLTTITNSSIVPLSGHHLQHAQAQPQALHSPVRWTKSNENSRQGRPVDVMADVMNDLGVKILDRYLDNTGNVAFSPSGLGFVLVALYEGSAGSSSREISDVLGLPRDRRVTRIGLRDIHRRLRSYLNADAFLGGLTLNRDDINLRPDYEDILRFYGFDISDSGSDSNSTMDSTLNSEDSSNSTTTMMTPDSSTIPDSNDTTTDSNNTTNVQVDTTGPTTMGTIISDDAVVMTDMTGGTNSAFSMVPPGGVSSTSVPTTLAMMSQTSMTNFTSTTNSLGTTPEGTNSALSMALPGGVVSTSIPTNVTIMSQTAMTNSTNSTNSLGTTPGGTNSALSMAPPGGVFSSNLPTTLQMMSQTVMMNSTSTTNSPGITPISTGSNINAGILSTNVTNGLNTVMPMQRILELVTEAADMQTQNLGPSASSPNPTTPMTNSETNPMTILTSPVTTSVSTTTGSLDNINGNLSTTEMKNTTTNIVEDTATNTVRKRRGILHGPSGYFSSSAGDGIWLDEFGRLTNHDDYQSQDEDIGVDPRRPTEVAFLINGCDYSRVTAASYTAILPFSYFPSLRASLLEFPLDDPRYKILVMLPSDENGTRRLARILATKPITLRRLRRSLQPTWVTAIIPSFMLRGFVTLTPYLQRLGISDVFDPRAADLTPMSPDLGVYARDIQQSIGVNIRNNAKGGIGGADGGNEEQQSQQRDDLIRSVRGVDGIHPPFFLAGGAISPRSHGNPHYPSYPGAGNPLYERAPPVPFVVDHPFLYFIIDDETSVTLLAGRIDDPLNSRML